MIEMKYDSWHVKFLRYTVDRPFEGMFSDVFDYAKTWCIALSKVMGLLLLTKWGFQLIFASFDMFEPQGDGNFMIVFMLGCGMLTGAGFILASMPLMRHVENFLKSDNFKIHFRD